MKDFKKTSTKNGELFLIPLEEKELDRIRFITQDPTVDMVFYGNHVTDEPLTKQEYINKYLESYNKL